MLSESRIHELRRAIAFDQYDAAFAECLIEGASDYWNGLSSVETMEARRFWYRIATN
jgi:hypothetical protein